MLAPFTAGWQMKAGTPLVIERGEVHFHAYHSTVTQIYVADLSSRRCLMTGRVFSNLVSLYTGSVRLG